MEQENFNPETAAENTEKSLKDSRTSKPDYVAKAKQEREAEEEKRQIAATRRQLDVDAYDREHSLLSARYDKRKAEISNTRIKAISTENGKFEAGMYIDEHRENLSQIEKEYKEGVNKLTKEFRGLFEELQRQYPDGYRASNKSWYNGSEN